MRYAFQSSTSSSIDVPQLHRIQHLTMEAAVKLGGRGVVSIMQSLHYMTDLLSEDTCIHLASFHPYLWFLKRVIDEIEAGK